MDKTISENNQVVIMNRGLNKKCISCQTMWAKKNNNYCWRCDPNRKHLPYQLPSFNKLTTLTGIRRAYGNILNAIRKKKISREEANCLFYGLKSFVGSLKEIVDMKMVLEKGDNNKPLITDVKIEQLRLLVDKMESLQNKFAQKNTPIPSGEIEVKIIESNNI